MKQNQRMIKRKKEMDMLTDHLRAQGGANSFSFLYGPLGIGKTTLLRQWIKGADTKKNINARRFVFYTSLLSAADFYEYWMMVLEQFSARILESSLESAAKVFVARQKAKDVAKEQAASICKEIEEIYLFAEQTYVGTVEQRKKIMQCVQNIFCLYSQLDIQVTVIIDDMDYAKTLGEKSGDGDLVFRTMYTLAIRREEMKTLNVVLAANKSLRVLCDCNELGAELELVYASRFLGGFSAKEMEEFYETFSGKEYLTKRNKNMIRYYCGNHPGLLQKFRMLFETWGEHSVYNMERLFENNKSDFFPVYEHFYGLLCHSTVEQNGEKLSLLDVFLKGYEEGMEKQSVQPWLDCLSAAGIPYLSSYFIKYVMVKVHPEKISMMLAAAEEKKNDDAEEERKPSTRFPVPTEEEIQKLIGKQVVYCHERVSATRGARGFIVKPRFGACMSKKKRQSVGFMLPGVDVDVVIDKWNEALGMFEVSPVISGGEQDE